MLEFSLAVASPDSEITANILKGVARHVDVALKAAAVSIRIRVSNVADSLIRNTKEFQSLMSGDLQGHMGLADPEAATAAILKAIRDGVEVWSDPIRVVGGRLDGGLNVGILKQGYADLLSLAEAKYVSKPSGETIPWLDWLLTQGNRILVRTHAVKFGISRREMRYSRSKKAIMVGDVAAGSSAATWRVPPEFSGTAEDNFLTRAFNVPEVESLLATIMAEEITKRL